jgi:hypothetical protein
MAGLGQCLQATADTLGFLTLATAIEGYQRNRISSRLRNFLCRADGIVDCAVEHPDHFQAAGSTSDRCHVAISENREMIH